MIRLELLRRDRGWSQRQLGAAADVNASYICNAERQRMKLYPGQAQRIAEALGWTGDPEILFEEVNINDVPAKTTDQLSR